MQPLYFMKPILAPVQNRCNSVEKLLQVCHNPLITLSQLQVWTQDTTQVWQTYGKTPAKKYFNFEVLPEASTSHDFSITKIQVFFKKNHWNGMGWLCFAFSTDMSVFFQTSCFLFLFFSDHVALELLWVVISLITIPCTKIAASQVINPWQDQKKHIKYERT